MERTKPGEGAATAAIRLWGKVEHRNWRYCDMLCVNALYAQAPFISAVNELGRWVVIKLKQDYYDLVRDMDGLVAGRPPDVELSGMTPKGEPIPNNHGVTSSVRAWDEEGFTSWDGVDCPLRCLKVVETKTTTCRGEVIKVEGSTYHITLRELARQMLVGMQTLHIVPGQNAYAELLRQRRPSSVPPARYGMMVPLFRDSEAISVIYGDRVVLREFRREDAGPIHRWVGDEEITKHLGFLVFPQSLEETIAFVERQLTKKGAPNEGIFVIALRNDPNLEYIGAVGLHGISWRDRHAELGIVIGREDLLGKGLGTEAIRLALDFAFGFLNMHKVNLRVFEYNERGRRCYRRCGFIEEGRIREQRFYANRYWDEIIMGITCDEFARTR